MPSPDVVIKAEGIGKRYQLGERVPYKSLRDSLARVASAPWRFLRDRACRLSPLDSRQSKIDNSFWALQDVGFEIGRGEAVGIIGRNGAGKSTLLKILSRITEPTTGRIELVGRVASLLEVGTGFHPELTGRENVFLNGAILGMKRAEIIRKFDEIVAFAEVERFIDTPVKHYSSGMYMRLAFSVAAHLEPEILLVDEVLAVGDAEFQRRCLGKMGEVAQEGRTVLFVSHSEYAVRRLCTRCILLSQGGVTMAGPTNEVMSEYQGRHFTSALVTSFVPNPAASIQYTSVRVSGTACPGTDHLSAAAPLTVSFGLEVSDAIPDVYFGIVIHNADGIAVLFADSRDCPGTMPRRLARGHHSGCISIPPVLAPGTYRVSAGIAATIDRHSFDLKEGACSFRLADVAAERQDPRPGILNLRLPWSVHETQE